MDFPTINWMIANLIGVIIYMVLWYIFDVLCNSQMPISYYVFLFVLFIVVTILDFYVYHKTSLQEEKKSIWDQLRDMVGSFGITIVILIICGLFTIYYNIKYARDLHNMYKIRDSKEFKNFAAKIGTKLKKNYKKIDETE